MNNEKDKLSTLEYRAKEIFKDPNLSSFYVWLLKRASGSIFRVLNARFSLLDYFFYIRSNVPRTSRRYFISSEKHLKKDLDMQFDKLMAIRIKKNIDTSRVTGSIDMPVVLTMIGQDKYFYSIQIPSSAYLYFICPERWIKKEEAALLEAIKLESGIKYEMPL